MGPSRRDTWLGHYRAAAALAAFQALAPREPFLVVKGVALCARYRWDPADVPISDIDIRVTPRSWWRLRKALHRDPRLVQDTPPYANLVLELAGHLVDVEATCGPPFLTRLRVEHLLGRAELAELPGAEPFLVPSTTDHALLLAINLFKDGLSMATEHARRNALRIVEESDFDPETFVRRARFARLTVVARTAAVWLAPASPTWRALAEALRSPSHAVYSFFHAALHRRPASFGAAVVRRLGADSTVDRAASLALGAVHVASRRRRA